MELKIRYDPAVFIDTFGDSRNHASHERYTDSLAEKNKHWLYKPCGFQVRLDGDGQWKSQLYKPTFYVPADRQFVHVVSTYSAYYDYHEIFDAFRMQYPQHSLAIVNYSGSRIGTNEKNLHKKCSVIGCEVDAIVKGMCRAHYYKVKRGMMDPSGKVIGIDHRVKAVRDSKAVTPTPKKKMRKVRYRRAL